MKTEKSMTRTNVVRTMTRKTLVFLLACMTVQVQAQEESTEAPHYYLGVHLGAKPFFYDSDYKNSPLYSITYQHELFPKFGIRGMFGYGTQDYGGSELEKNVAISLSAVYDVITKDKFSLYAQAGLWMGRRLVNSGWYAPKFNLRGGLRYSFNEHFSLYTDIGIGSTMANLGLAYQF